MSRVYSKVVQLFIYVLKCGCIDISCAVLYLVAQSCPALCDPMTVACRAPRSTGFSRQEYWRGLPCPPPGDLPDPGIEPRCPTLQADSLPSEPPGKPRYQPHLGL